MIRLFLKDLFPEIKNISDMEIALLNECANTLDLEFFSEVLEESIPKSSKIDRRIWIEVLREEKFSD